jgi:c-di-GMP-binding flagellar brake protein YcgR
MFGRRKRKENAAPASRRTEKRRHPRKPASLPVSYQIICGRDPKRRSAIKSGALKDISDGGLCFFTADLRSDGLHVSYDDTPMHKNQLLLKVGLPPPHGPLMVLAHVIWFERGMGDKADYAVGVEFLKFKDEGEQILQQYLRSPK